MRKLVALLSFYDERPEDLARLVHSLPTAGVTHLLALDGAYALYPNAQPSSSQAEHYTLRDAASAAGIHLTLRIPSVPWAGNEIEKRTNLFALAERITTPDDWYLVIDGDEHVTTAPNDVRDQLANSIFDVAELTFREHQTTAHHPRLFRAIRGLHCHTNHYSYRTPDNRYLWGNARTTRLEPRLPLHQLTLEHNPRAPRRRLNALAYYKTRDHERIEHDFPLALA